MAQIEGNHPARRCAGQRAGYDRAISAQESFIVPLLRIAIEGAISKYASSPAPGARAVDIGCGRQPFRPRLVAAGYQYWGIDAQQNQDGTVDFLAMADEPLSADLLAVGPSDLALCTEVLEHVANPAMAFANIRALLKPGGVAIITSPFFYPLHEEPYDFWRPTLHALRHLAGEQSLSVLEARALGGAWDVLGTALAAASPGPQGWGIAGRGIRLLLRCGRRPVLLAVRSKTWHHLLPLASRLYLANFLVVRR